MLGVGGETRDEYADETAGRRVGERARAGLVFFVVCLALSAVFEIARYPERTRWMLGFAIAFVVLAGACATLLARLPARSVPILIAFVNVVGAGLNAYHAIVGASVAMCLWTLTGLMGSTAVFLRWGGVHQALAAPGAVLFYGAHLAGGGTDPLTWAAGGTYLVVMVAMSAFGAALYAGYLRSGLRLERTLSEREARLQSFFDLAPVGTAIIHPDGVFHEVNDALCRLLGSARHELLRRRWFDLAHPDDRAAALAQVDEAFAGGAPARLPARLVRRDGVTIEAAVDVRGLPGARGAIDHLMVLVEDVTERRRTERERERLLDAELAARRTAEAASRAKDEFLATLSHELRTPLSPILAWADLIRRRVVSPEQTDRGLAAIARNATAQARLIDELLDVSRIVSGKLALDLHPVDLGPVIVDAVEATRPAAEAKGLQIATQVPPAGCHVLGDADRLRQVVSNLLSNAIKFTPAGGRVCVALAADGAEARLVVADTGQGIAAAFLPEVFERFRQADTRSTRRQGGLGLGLAIVRELVELHGGTVRAESAGEGRGATFTVALPRTTAARAAAEPARAARGGDARLHGLRILVVDDDPDSNDVVRTLLASFGAEVRTAASADEALTVAAAWRPDVVVSDIAMPGEDGYALLARLRAATALGTVPAIALTAYSAPSDRERALRAGFDAHVAKPVRPPELVHAVVAAREARARLQ